MLTFRKLTLKPYLSRGYISSRFFISLPSSNISSNNEEPTSAYYDNLINIAGRSRDFAAVHHLLNKRFENRIFNTTNTFKFITNTESEADFAALLDELIGYLIRLNGGFSRKNAFDTLIIRLCKLNRIEESLRVIDVMFRSKFGANVLTFYPILSTITRKRGVEEAWRVMKLMREHEISPDRTAYNYILTSYCVIGDLNSSIRVLSEMENEGLSADSRTYDAMVLGACRAGKVEAALVVLRRMVDDGVAILYCTYVHVIIALLEQCYYAQAVEFVMAHGGQQKGLDVEIFGTLAIRLIRLERFEDAKLVIKEMKKMNLVLKPELDAFYRNHIRTHIQI